METEIIRSEIASLTLHCSSTALFQREKITLGSTNYLTKLPKMSNRIGVGFALITNLRESLLSDSTSLNRLRNPQLVQFEGILILMAFASVSYWSKQVQSS
jgi:hypothetical protein